MGKKASIIAKSTKTPVTVYRMFLKFSMVFAVLSLFLLASGKSVVESATPIILAVICAAAYSLCYYFYKLETKSKVTAFRIEVLKRFLSFLLGLFIILIGSVRFVAGEKIYGVVFYVIGLIACQCLHNNKNFISHLSTFFANASTGVVAVAMLMMYENIRDIKYLILISVSAVMVLISEIFYRAYSNRKHSGKNSKKRKSSVKKTKDDLSKAKIIVGMVAEQVICSVLIIVVIGLVWALLILTGSIETVFKANTYEKVTKLMPICISLITVSVLIWNNFLKTPKEVHISFDLRADTAELRKKLRVMFGNKSEAVKALDYVTKHMTRENGYSRWNGDNYYVHPIAVASILLDHTDTPDDDEIAAALLHDCAEDLIKSGEEGRNYSAEDYKEYTSDYINNEEYAPKYIDNLFKRQEAYLEYISVAFNDNIRNIVEFVTKGYEKNGDPKDYRKEEVMKAYLENISKNISATKIKIADRMNNNSTLTVCTKEKKQNKTLETQKYYLPFARKASDKDRENIEFYEKAAKFFEQEIK